MRSKRVERFSIALSIAVVFSQAAEAQDNQMAETVEQPSVDRSSQRALEALGRADLTLEVPERVLRAVGAEGIASGLEFGRSPIRGATVGSALGSGDVPSLVGLAAGELVNSRSFGAAICEAVRVRNIPTLAAAAGCVVGVDALIDNYVGIPAEDLTRVGLRQLQDTREPFTQTLEHQIVSRPADDAIPETRPIPRVQRNPTDAFEDPPEREFAEPDAYGRCGELHPEIGFMEPDEREDFCSQLAEVCPDYQAYEYRHGQQPSQDHRTSSLAFQSHMVGNQRDAWIDTTGTINRRLREIASIPECEARYSHNPRVCGGERIPEMRAQIEDLRIQRDTLVSSVLRQCASSFAAQQDQGSTPPQPIKGLQ